MSLFILLVNGFFSDILRLEEEGNLNQKLTQERTVAENRIKGLEEQITVNDDNINKVPSYFPMITSH